MRNFINKIWGFIEAEILKILKVILRIMGKDFTRENYETVIQFVQFGIVGLSNTAISYSLYVICLLLFQKLDLFQNKRYLVAQSIAFVLSVLWSFYWNNKVVFTLQENEERSAFRALIKMFISYSFTGLFLNSILLVLWVRVMHISEFIAPIINIIIGIPFNFVINKIWTFSGDSR